jgi:phosphate starvation-inducible membrane PsiE
VLPKKSVNLSFKASKKALSYIFIVYCTGKAFIITYSRAEYHVSVMCSIIINITDCGGYHQPATEAPASALRGF